jgi:hypothetical protein
VVDTRHFGRAAEHRAEHFAMQHAEHFATQHAEHFATQHAEDCTEQHVEQWGEQWARQHAERFPELSGIRGAARGGECGAEAKIRSPASCAGDRILIWDHVRLLDQAFWKTRM